MADKPKSDDKSEQDDEKKVRKNPLGRIFRRRGVEVQKGTK